jgi:papain like cysteine protease AvrRpt2
MGVPPATPKSADLPFYPFCIQEERMWCWAATLQGAVLFCAGEQYAQCDFASTIFGWDCCTVPRRTACNRPYRTAKALDAFGLLREVRSGAITGIELFAELRAQRPVIAIMEAGDRTIRHAVTIVGVQGPAPWLVSVNDPSGLQVRSQHLSVVTAEYRGFWRWVETLLLKCNVSLAPSEGERMPSVRTSSKSATVGAVRIAMYVAEPADVLDGATTANARLAAFETFADDGGDHVVEVPPQGGDGGAIYGPVADAILRSVPLYERRYGPDVRLLQVAGLFVTAIWLNAGEARNERIVPIYTLSREVEVGHPYAPDQFEWLLRAPALEHVREAKLEHDERGPEGGR